ncbi:MAG: DAK2 domain-containing protein [Actinomycetota bacterium]|jgi:DAK2 domain fusion protein YloV|nr:DAK2 domain-containing protein [Actinomycetota bacterium]
MAKTNRPTFQTLLQAASAALKERSEDVNKLNVFPVPDGDTGTNMSLTMDAVVGAVSELPAGSDIAAVCHAVTHGSLMGARGNSGVILSQILRGLCEEIDSAAEVDSALVARAMRRSVTVAFQAVRKPVEGTMLTVLRDSTEAAESGIDEGLSLGEMLERVTSASFDSVKRTPELLPVLKENGVVDAGGFGLAILAEGLVAAYEGHDVKIDLMAGTGGSEIMIELVNDWDDDEYLYCTEFLLFGSDLSLETIRSYVEGVGGSELVVGEGDMLKIHLHTDDPGTVLTHMTSLGEVSEVHINNMRRQTADRTRELTEVSAASSAPKPVGFVTVAVGEGVHRILHSLGADVVVSGGQTMNPSTAELLAASEKINADSIVILPNNRNIIMAAQQVNDVSDKRVSVVPTTSAPEAFAALLAFDPGVDMDDAIAEMTEAASCVRTGEVTTAVKDSVAKSGDIKAGQIIGITDHEIEVIGDDVTDVTVRLAELIVGDGETLTLLGGEDISTDELEVLAGKLEKVLPDVEVETHDGGQPLYPVIIAVE